MIDAKSFEQNIANAEKKYFNRWMENPTTKILISIVPPCEHLEAILRAAFNAGHCSGQSAILLEMFKAQPGPGDQRI